MTRCVRAATFFALIGGTLLAGAAPEPLEDASWGFSFQAPDGWMLAERSAEGALLASPDGTAYLLVERHEFSSREQLAAAARDGYQDAGVYLVPTGAIQDWQRGGIAIEMKGLVEGQSAKAFGIGLVSPYGGGAIVLGAAGESQWSAAHRQLVEDLAETVEFSRPAPDAGAGEATDWRQKLSGRCLAYLQSSGSSGPSHGGYATGSYTSDKAAYYLYPDGSFEGSSSSTASFDSGGGFGSSSGGTGPQRGRWEIVTADGGSALELRYPDGSVVHHRLTTNERGHTFLDGSRWFVVSYEECHDL